MSNDLRETAAGVRENAVPITGSAADYDALLERIGDAHFVLLGGSTVGTHEFYRERALITRRLIREKGFRAVAIDGDWADARRVDHFVRGGVADAGAAESTRDFLRFPAWIWRNTDVVEFIDWLRRHNDALDAGEENVGFFGLDFYNLHSSLAHTIDYLDRVDPQIAERARHRFAHCDLFHGMNDSCEPRDFLDLSDERVDEIAARLESILRRVLHPDKTILPEYCAAVISHARQYYRGMLRDPVSSWNQRERQMEITLDRLADALQRENRPAKIVVWGHSVQLGDAQATDLGQAGETSLGQLVRLRHGGDNVLVGFSTFRGSVTAASGWDEPAEAVVLPRAYYESYESVLHAVGFPQFFLLFGSAESAASALAEPRLERSVGIIYHPLPERAGDHFAAILPFQFDVVIHLDETHPVEPLEHFAPMRAADGGADFSPSG